MNHLLNFIGSVLIHLYMPDKLNKDRFNDSLKKQINFASVKNVILTEKVRVYKTR